MGPESQKARGREKVQTTAKKLDNSHSREHRLDFRLFEKTCSFYHKKKANLYKLTFFPLRIKGILMFDLPAAMISLLSIFLPLFFSKPSYMNFLEVLQGTIAELTINYFNSSL
jgi:hypothetical protein